MDFYKIIGIAFALAVDASVVAFSYGLILRSNRFIYALKLAIVTASFQAVMPVLGYLFTGTIHKYIKVCDHWIAFSVFVILGAIIIACAWKEDKKDEGIEQFENIKQTLSLKKMLGIGVATSIDALAAGAGIACMKKTNDTTIFMCDSIICSAVLIGVVTFICVLSSFYSTRFFKKIPTRFLETIAGLILIALGIIILIQHTCY